MRIQADYQSEKCEIEVLLASGIFNRAPNQVQILNYISSKYFEGTASEIKEYNIAVDALGRGPDFDQKRDSIVRVEAHRLRKRLKEYYAGEGFDHVVHIEIPAGQYAPRFVLRQTAQDQTPAAVSPSSPPAPTQTPSLDPSLVGVEFIKIRPATRRWQWWPVAVVPTIGVLVALVSLMLVHGGSTPTPIRNASAYTGDQIRIQVGAATDTSSYVDAFNHSWRSDRFFSGGTVFESESIVPIWGTRDPHLYQSRREGAFSYDIPLSPGVYELHLYFAETLYGDNNIAGGGESSRIFSISANGRPLLTEFDVIRDVGPSTADVKVFKDLGPSSDGKLHLRFDPGPNPAFLNGLEVVPGVPGRMLPLRMVSRDRGFVDPAGRSWDADRYVRGGLLVLRHEPILGTSTPELYRGERFGNLTYTIPVAQPGRYGVNLHFAESWFGPGRPGGGGEGSRIFDILLNGVALRRNFDIFKEAGGPHRALVLSFHDLEPNPEGKLILSLVPRRNYAEINALEILDESK